jgi:hypothetical protein
VNSLELELLANSRCRTSTRWLGEHKGDKWVLTTGEGRQPNGGGDWATAVSTGGVRGRCGCLLYSQSHGEVSVLWRNLADGIEWASVVSEVVAAPGKGRRWGSTGF